MLGRAAKILGQRLFGGTCFVCRGAAARGLLCRGCDADLPRLRGEQCPRCALPAPAAGPCGRCLASPPRYDATIAAVAYDFPADVLIQALKFHGELAVAPLLAELLLGQLSGAARVDCLLPVPLSAHRLRARGYNQALEIARPLARATGAPIEASLGRRVRDTPPQSELPWAARSGNVRGAFAVERAASGARVAVVDDVMTTGATLDALAAALKEAGAASVVNWVVARTLPPA